MKKVKETRGLTKEQYFHLANQGIQLMMSIDPIVLSRLLYLSQSLEVPIWLVIQNIIIKDWARNCAQFETGERANPSEASEFRRRELKDGSKQLITGRELFDYLEEIYKKEYAEKSS